MAARWDLIDAGFYATYRTVCYIGWVLWKSVTSPMTLREAMNAVDQSVQAELDEQTAELRRQKMRHQILTKPRE